MKFKVTHRSEETWEYEVESDHPSTAVAKALTDLSDSGDVIPTIKGKKSHTITCEEIQIDYIAL